MFRIVEKELRVEFPRGHHLHSLIAQIPNCLGDAGAACRIADPDANWQQIHSVLKLVSDAPGNLKKLHFLFFPEASLPSRHLGDALEIVGEGFAPNSITAFGVDHLSLGDFCKVLQRYRQDNEELLASVLEDMDAGAPESIPVNWCAIAVKESDGKLRVFIEAKSHPFVGEETINPSHDLYRGKVFPLFRCLSTGFNFMCLICFDYVYRDLYQSNISEVIEKANELFFSTRQRLDLLAVLECNPKPEHPAFRDVLNGFYGEYLSYTPGVRDSVTLFCNSSSETSGGWVKKEHRFGASSVIMHRGHKVAHSSLREFSVDDFGGLPVCRLRFGEATRLYYFNLPLFHELDPRTTRVPLKIHSIFAPTDEGGWAPVDWEN